METEATHVTRVLNRRRVIMMITRGAISQRGIKRTPDADRSQIRPINSRKTTRPFLRKNKTKVNNETRKQITKSPTHRMEIPDDKKKESLCGCDLVCENCISQ